LQRYRELLKQKQDEKCIPTSNKTSDEESYCSNENVAPSGYHNKNHLLNYQGKREGVVKHNLIHKTQISYNNSRHPPQSLPAQPLRASKNLQQLYRNSRKEAEGDNALDVTSIDTVQLSSSSQCSVASLADEILNESFFDQKPAHPENCDFILCSEKDDQTFGGGLLSFLVDDSLNTSVMECNNIAENSKAPKSTTSAQDLERKLSLKFENNDSSASYQNTKSTIDQERISGKKMTFLQKQMKTYPSHESSSVLSSKSVQMLRHRLNESADIEALDVSRVVSDDDEEETVASDIRAPESIMSVSSAVSWSSSKGGQQKPFSPFTTLRCNSVDIALDETKQYAMKIDELTKALEKAQGDITYLKDQRRTDKDTILQLSRQARVKEEEMFQLLKRGTDGQKVSTVVPQTEFSVSQLKAELEKEERRNATLLKRNETLIKESKFADQTCVELSCRNQALEAELERMDQELKKAKEENEGLNGVIIRAAQYGSKLESEYEALILHAAEQRTRLETQLEETRNSLVELNCKNDTLIKQSEQQNKEKAVLEMQVQDYDRRNKSLEFELEQMKPCDSIQVNFNETHLSNEFTAENLHDQQPGFEKNEIHHTPTKSDLKHYSFGVHTPTSHVLAKTLQFELLKGHHVNERVVEGEKALAVVQSKYQNASQELDLEKEKVSFLQDKLAKASSDVDIAKQALAAWIEPLLFFKHELQKLLQNGNFTNETCAKGIELEATDDLTKAKVIARNITQDVTNLAKRIFAERAHMERELIHWKDLASRVCQDLSKDCKKCNSADESNWQVDGAQNELQEYEPTESCSTLLSKSSHSAPQPLFLNDHDSADETKSPYVKTESEKSQSDLQQAKSQLYLIKQECRLLSTKHENSQKYLKQNLKEKENLVKEKNELLNQKQLLETENRECHVRMRELKDVTSNLANDLAAVKSDLNECNKRKNELDEQLRCLGCESEEIIRSLNSQLESAKIEINEKAREITSLKERIERANNDARDAVNKCIAAENDANNLKMLISDAEQKAIVLECELDSMRSLKDLATNESLLLKQKLEHLETTFSAKSKEYNTLWDELQCEKSAFQAKWQSMVQKRCEEETEMQETIVLIKAELMATKDEYDGIISLLHKKLEESEQELSLMRVELNKANAKKERALMSLSDIESIDFNRM
jgi:hypothetical protein